MNKVIVGSSIVIVLAIGGIVTLFQGGISPTTPPGNGPTVLVNENGKQVIQIFAKGGYSPRNTRAKANTPTILKVTTNATFDCSSALSIPSIGFRKNLPPTGTTPIEIPPQQPGTTIRGTCAMGMYFFTIAFE